MELKAKCSFARSTQLAFISPKSEAITPFNFLTPQENHLSLTPQENPLPLLPLNFPYSPLTTKENNNINKTHNKQL